MVHAPSDESARDVEARVVPEEVSGHLTKDGSEASGQIISESQAAQWNREALEVHGRVKAMMEKYRPQALGNGESVVERPIQKQDVSQDVPRGADVIAHKGESDARDQNFWHALVSSNPESKVTKATAVFAIRTILVQVQGFKAHRARLLLIMIRS